jgi:hypothetical protein
VNAGTTEDMPDQHVKVKMIGHSETSALFQKRVKERLVVQDQISGRLVCQ